MDKKIAFFINIEYIKKYPKLLSSDGYYYEIYLSHKQYILLSISEKDNELVELIESAISDKKLSTYGVADLFTEISINYEIDEEVDKLNPIYSDLVLLQSVFQFRIENPNTEIYVALISPSLKLQKLLIENKMNLMIDEEIRKFSNQEFVLSLSSDSNTSVKVYKKILWKKYWMVYFGIYLMVILGFSKIIGIVNFNIPGDNLVQKVFLIFSILLSGLIIYLYREFQRPLYSIFEISIGLFSVCNALSKVSLNLYLLKNDSLSSISVIGGLYIIVRGIDNLIKSYPNNRLVKKLKVVFGINK